jgi:hypothetical protein
MAGLVPAIHVLPRKNKEDVDARHKAGHDERDTDRNHNDPARIRLLHGRSP